MEDSDIISVYVTAFLIARSSYAFLTPTFSDPPMPTPPNYNTTSTKMLVHPSFGPKIVLDQLFDLFQNQIIVRNAVEFVIKCIILSNPVSKLVNQV